MAGILSEVVGTLAAGRGVAGRSARSPTLEKKVSRGRYRAKKRFASADNFSSAEQPLSKVLATPLAAGF